MDVEGTYIKFVEGPPKSKTKTWWVVNKFDEIHLGWIGWFGKWRKYGFYPKADTVYEEVCLREIASFCESETKAHRMEKKNGKEEPRKEGSRTAWSVRAIQLLGAWQSPYSASVRI
jgi:hypothetical protein